MIAPTLYLWPDQKFKTLQSVSQSPGGFRALKVIFIQSVVGDREMYMTENA